MKITILFLLVFQFAAPVRAAETKMEKATFAGGCFWCMVTPFKELKGVKEIVAGYTGGNVKNPGYEKVSSGKTGHYEAVQIVFDPSKTSYAELLDVFWRQIDPTDASGQFADKGNQYRTAVFYHSEDQKKTAEKSRAEIEKSGKFEKPVVTEILKARVFYPAEKYHQDYPSKNPPIYEFYRQNSGRDQFLDKVWKKKEK